MHIITQPQLEPPFGQRNFRNRIAPPLRAPHFSFEEAGRIGLMPKGPGRNKALFLDRDGVINIERRYVHSREEFQFQEGIFELCQAAQSLGLILVVVTNQAGIAREYFTESEFVELTEWMIQEFAWRWIQIARVYYCPFHPIYGVGPYKFDSPDRKPRPGMLLRARIELDLNMSSSIIIGDKWSDIGAAEAAGVGTKILVRSLVTEAAVRKDCCHVVDSLIEIQEKFFCTCL